MTYFSRLTDIVTCNLTEILSRQADPKAAIETIIREMEEGLAGARRSVTTADASVDRLCREMEELRQQTDYWIRSAKKLLSAGDEEQARLALAQKQEVEDVIAGLEQQHHAAVSTRDHLSTTLRALEGRLAEARRKSQQIACGSPVPAPVEGERAAPSVPLDENRSRKLESELAALKRELGKT
jgi:phage shock protein A